ncbi:hypothetical protein JZU46_02035 [bacterium]|jgi:hypothetical protein|nr:hypothetical protein [bacterium]
MQTKNPFIRRWRLLRFFSWVLLIYYVVENIVFTMLYGWHWTAVTLTEEWWDYGITFLASCIVFLFISMLLTLLQVLANDKVNVKIDQSEE